MPLCHWCAARAIVAYRIDGKTLELCLGHVVNWTGKELGAESHSVLYDSLLNECYRRGML